MTGVGGVDLFDYTYCVLFSGTTLLLWQDGLDKVDLKSDEKCSFHDSLQVTLEWLGGQQWYLG